MDDPDVKLLLAVAVVVILAGGGWFFRDELLPAPESQLLATPEPVEADVDTAPAHPLAPVGTTRPGQADLVPLPPLDDSDSYFLLALIDVFGAAVEPLLVKEAIIDRFVATVDNLPRDRVAEKIRPVGRLAESFHVKATANDGPIYLDERNYRRYDQLVSRLAAADPEAVVGTYRRFYPLMQQSYERLGYPGAYFNDRVVEVIDHLLMTPQPAGPILLGRPHVLYEFADPGLQGLSSGQKLLLRMGNEHATTIKGILRKLRVALATVS